MSSQTRAYLRDRRFLYLFAVPWLLIKTEGGNQIYGLTTIGTAFANAFFAIICIFVGFGIAVLGIRLIPSSLAFCLFILMVGWGNAGTRVGRATVMMHIIPKEFIGRVNTFISIFRNAGMRAFLGVFTYNIDRAGAPFGFSVVLVVLAFGLPGLIASHKVFAEKSF